MENKYSFDEIVSHLKSSGFVYQGSEIYGGLSNSWDFGISRISGGENSSRDLPIMSVSIPRS